MSDGWDESAAAWIADMGDRGDYGREFVLDPVLTARVLAGSFREALDVGCGEGRFCRQLATLGVRPIGLDPTAALIERARERDPSGDYRIGRGENLAFPDKSFDLVVSYLTLIDIADIGSAIAEMARVLRPGGSLLIANLNSFTTAGPPTGWTRDTEGVQRFYIDHYLEERAEWVGWRGIRIINWHRPLSRYMSLLLGAGLELVFFDEPSPVGGDAGAAERYRRVPHFHVMEWRKPGARDN